LYAAGVFAAAYNIRVTNVTDVAFTVSWVSDDVETGSVRYGTSFGSLPGTAYDKRGIPHSGQTHYVEVTGLAPSTTYYFDVVSGGVTYSNGGSHYTAATAATLGAPSSDTIYGQVFKNDGSTPADGTIVLVTVRDNNGAGGSGDSQTLSCLVDGTGYWYVNIGPVRTADGSAYFPYSASGDSVVIAADGGADGEASQTVDTTNDTPAPAMVLGGSIEQITVAVTNVTDTTFTVSWTTAEAKTGSIKMGTSPETVSTTVDDKRGAATSARTHYVEVTGLSPSTPYYFDAVSGALTYNNGGAHYSVTTGPTLGAPSSDTIYGQVFKSDGSTPAEGTIAYVKVRDNNAAGGSGDSQTLSCLIDADGYWYVNIGPVRTTDHSAYFAYSASGDLTVASADGAGDGVASASVDTSADTPVASMTLH